jgi:hypothetical protein
MISTNLIFIQLIFTSSNNSNKHITRINDRIDQNNILKIENFEPRINVFHTKPNKGQLTITISVLFITVIIIFSQNETRVHSRKQN